MANQMPSAGTLMSTLTGTERVGGTQAGADRVLTPALILAYIQANLSVSGAPPIKVQNHHFSPVQQPSASGTGLAVGTYYGTLFQAKAGGTFDRVGFQIPTTPSAGGNFRVGVYNFDPTTRFPTTLIQDSGDIAFTTTSFASSTTAQLVSVGSAITIPTNGFVYVLCQTSAAFSVYCSGNAGVSEGLNLLPAPQVANMLTSVNAYSGLSGTGTYGAMPSTAPTLSGLAQAPIFTIYKT